MHTEAIILAWILKELCVYHIRSHLLTHHLPYGVIQAPEFENHIKLNLSSSQTAVSKCFTQRHAAALGGADTRRWEILQKAQETC